MNLRRAACIAGVFLAAGAGALENAYLVSDAVSQLERAFGVKARSSAWFVSGGASTLSFSFPGKGAASFRLADGGGERMIDQIQVEPLGPALTMDQATAFAKFVVDDVARSSKLSCAPVRDDQDGMNAFIVRSCEDKSNPKASPVQVTATIQSVGGRNLVFVGFSTKKR